MRRIGLGLAMAWAVSCGGDPGDEPTAGPGGGGGKADGFAEERGIEVLRTEPFCDVCTSADKTQLVASSRITARMVELVDGATESIAIAQFTFSDKNIEAAL